MPVNPTMTETLQEGEYHLSDPALLKDMRLSRDVMMPGSKAILVVQYTPITPRILEHLQRRDITTLFAEPIREKQVMAAVVQMEKMFAVMEELLQEMLGDINSISAAFQNQQEMKTLETLIRDNLEEIDQLFKTDPTEKLVALMQHHNGTARHSIVAAFHLMALGLELGWDDTQIVKAAFGALSHDIGKTKIALETLNWPGRLNNEQWKEIRHHTLFGARLLYQQGTPPDLVMLAALLHHEWYAYVKGKGYGGLTLFTDVIQNHMYLNIPEIVANLDPEDLEIIQATALADMVSALEESRAYKRELDAFKVLIIMNTDARMGHFNPKQFAAWHTIYMRQNPKLLPRGQRMALPREKERRIFTPRPPQPIKPTPLLTYYEMEQLGFLTLLDNVGMDMGRIRRRGGLTLKVVEKINQERGLNLDYSPATLNAHGITLEKTALIREEQVLELDAWREWFTVEELEATGLLYRAKARHFNLAVIRSEGGITPEKLQKRGLFLTEKTLENHNIQPLKKWPITLPGSEERLTPEDLKKIGLTDQDLKQAGCLERVKKVKNGVPLAWLREQGLALDNATLARHKVDPVRKVFYDIQVMEEISATRAKFQIMREGDNLGELQTKNAQRDLEPLQDLLLNKIGHVVIDFADVIALPDLSGITQGHHWG